MPLDGLARNDRMVRALDAAAEILSDRRRWTKGPVSGGDGKRPRHCIVTAIHAVSGNVYDEAALHEAIAAQLPAKFRARAPSAYNQITLWNDRWLTRHRDVVALLGRVRAALLA
jgi:hypothetical protein